MAWLEKFALRVHARPVSLALLVLCCVVIALLFISQGGQSDQARELERAEYGQRLLKSSQERLTQQVALYRQQIEKIAKWEMTAQALNDTDSEKKWQATLKQLMPGLQQACLYEQVPLMPESGCMSLTYASLDTMRSLKQASPANLVLIRQQGQAEQLLLAAKFDTPAAESAVVALSVDPNVLFSGLQTVAKNIYLELTQGEASKQAIKAMGDPAIKQGNSDMTAMVEGSRWQFSLWTAPVIAGSNWTLPVTIMLVLALFWILRELWQSKLLKQDSATLEEQLSDLQQLKMRNRYPMTNPELTYVSQTIHQIGVPKRGQRPVTVEEENRANDERPEELTRANESEVDEIPDMDPEQGFELTEETIESDLAEVEQNSDVIEYDRVDPATAVTRKPPQESQEASDSAARYQRDDLVAFDNSELTLDLEESEQPPTMADEKAPIPETDDPALLSTETEDEATLPEPELNDNSLMPARSIFRKYDIRGVVGEELTVPVMRVLGQAIGSLVQEQGHKALNVGYDGRLSSPPLARAFIRGVISSGCDVTDIGQVPTPMLYFANAATDISSGVMITGSHNPTDFNGLKVVVDGHTLLGDEITAIHERISQGRLIEGKGTLTTADLFAAYLERIGSEIKLERPLKVVVDCANSVAGDYLPTLLTQIGCEVVPLFCEVDGRFPNHHPDPGQPQNLVDLQQKVTQTGADLGIAVDGDADRLGVIDSEGQIIWPDRLLAVFCGDLLAHNAGASVLYDVKCSHLIRQRAQALGGQATMVPSGHSVIKAEMAKTGALLAGEMTGHFFFKDRWYGFDDAMYAACRLLELIAKNSQSSSAFFAAVPDYHATPEIIIRLPAGKAESIVAGFAAHFDSAGATLSMLDGVRADYEDGWGLVRSSNTMPAISLRFEAQTVARLDEIKHAFREQLQSQAPEIVFRF
jgi:phosphomannomutase/phosphoglucomutase